MKTNELMIGDWVCHKDYPSIPLQVNGVSSKLCLKHSLLWNEESSKYERIERYSEADYDDLRPVKITDEILEKNGFTRYSVAHFNLQQWVLNEGNGCRVSFYQDVKIGKWVIKDIWIDYIHELQHVMRLCGIDKEIVL